MTTHVGGLIKPYNSEAMQGEDHRTEGELRANRVLPTMRLECTGISCAAVAQHRTPLMDRSCQLVINTVFNPSEQCRFSAGMRLTYISRVATKNRYFYIKQISNYISIKQ